MTLIQIVLERNVEGRTLAWALDYPGVFTYGADDAEAILRMPREMLRFESWLNLRTDYPWVRLEGLDVHIDEIFEVFPVDDEGEIYEVNAFFRSDHYLHMNGQEVYKFAVSAAADDVDYVTKAAGLTADGIDYFLLHQANIRIIEAAKQRLNIAPERFLHNMERYGNTSAASIPVLLDECRRAGTFRPGDILAMSAFGAGLTSGACLIRWSI